MSLFESIQKIIKPLQHDSSVVIEAKPCYCRIYLYVHVAQYLACHGNTVVTQKISNAMPTFQYKLNIIYLCFELSACRNIY